MLLEVVEWILNRKFSRVLYWLVYFLVILVALRVNNWYQPSWSPISSRQASFVQSQLISSPSEAFAIIRVDSPSSHDFSDSLRSTLVGARWRETHEEQIAILAIDRGIEIRYHDKNERGARILQDALTHEGLPTHLALDGWPPDPAIVILIGDKPHS